MSDKALNSEENLVKTIGMAAIKQRRLCRNEVPFHPGTFVGDYVPFYFCPRSIMLYVINQANHPDLSYRGGQSPIVHLEASLIRVVEWAESNGIRWAFSLTNAGALFTEFRSGIQDLKQLNWAAIETTDFRNPDVKDFKQAEFLVHGSFPFELIHRIGVYSNETLVQTSRAIARSEHRPSIEMKPEWYF